MAVWSPASAWHLAVLAIFTDLTCIPVAALLAPSPRPSRLFLSANRRDKTGAGANAKAAAGADAPSVPRRPEDRHARDLIQSRRINRF